MQLLHFSKGPDSFAVSLYKMGAGVYGISVGGSDFVARFVLEKVSSPPTDQRWTLWNKNVHEVLTGGTAASLVDALVHADFAMLNEMNTRGDE